MKPIKITEANRDKIDAAIDEAEGKRCSARLLYSVQVLATVDSIEKDLSRRLYKKDWLGLVIECDPNAQTFPNCYKGTPESTHFTIERRASGWFLTKVWREQCTNTEYHVCGGFKDKAEKLVSFANANFGKRG